MKHVILFFALFLFVGALQSQQIQSISTGTGYKKQSFVKLDTGTETLVDDTAWDLAFTVYGTQDAGIHMNESAGSSNGMALPGLEVFDAQTTNFAATIDPATLTDKRMYNPELTWAYGALNEGRSAANPFDYGWGVYQPATNTVVGSKVFVVKLRNGSYRKLLIQSLSNTLYTIKHAQLNGTDEKTVTIDKAAHSGKLLAYLNLTTNQLVQAEPAGGFDLFYCRYITTLYDPATMTNINYNLTGILSGRGVEVAKATGIDPLTVSYANWDDSLKTRLDVIGHDWKTFTGAGWEVPTDVVYFVRTANDRVWKLQFIDFEGSATGVAVFEKTDLGVITNVIAAEAPVSSFDVYPNPARENVQLLYQVKQGETEPFRISVIDMTGKTIKNTIVAASTGLQHTELSVSGLSDGMYQLVISGANGTARKTLIIQN
jgi:hypothetical protein